MGYTRAGFTVTGVDINPQPNYPFRFIQQDALTLTPDFLRGFDVVHASPPCQAYSVGSRRWIAGGREYPDLVEPTRKLLIESGRSYVIENVPGAPLDNPILLCGEMFGLRIIRHRLFESNVGLWAPPHIRHRGTVKDGAYVTVAGHGGDGSNRFDDWCEAMGMWHMTKDELRESIPPAYTEFLGRQLNRVLSIAS